MADTKKPFHEAVAEKLIEQLKAGTAPWQRPWSPGEPGGYMPMNPTTGKRYKGINAIQLLAQGRTDSRWMTYKQAKAAGAQVRKGEKGTPVQYWKFSEEQDKLDDNGRPVKDDQGKPVKETVMLERPRVFFATVFNAEQIDGLPVIERKPQSWDAVERAEHILKASGATIRHGENNRAFYRPATDSIHLPDKGQFPTADNYYATALHELGHWTGHPSRLDRDLSHPFGSEGYAKEELRAEISSMILGDELGIGHDPEQHAAYVGSWIKALEDDPLEIFRASAEAEKIQEYVLAFEQKQIQEQEQEQTITQATEADQQQQEVGMQQQTNQQQRERLLATLDAAEAQAIERAAEARRRHAAGEIEAQEYENATQEALGVTLPADWNGRTQVQGNVTVESDGEQFVEPAHAVGRDPEFWGVYAQHDNGMHQWLADFDSQEQADELAAKLALVDAIAETNEHEQAAKLARVQEERVRRDPGSTDEDISAAKEARKAAEATAMLNDADMQRRIAEHEREERERQQAQQAQPQDKPERTYINVPYREKNEAKALGARWDRQEQSWFVPPGVDTAPFAKWAQQPAQEAAQSTTTAQPTQEQAQGRKAAQERAYLAVPYGERGAAKAAGALWDKAAKSWYAGPKADMEKLQRWLPENVQGQQGPAMTPREEFAEALKSLGCVVSGDHPIMDGKKHRIGVEGDKKGEQAGFYVGHLDGHPAGYIKNNRTGVDMKWKSKGYSLDPQEKAKLQAEAAEKLAARQAEQERQQEATAQRVSRQTESLVPVSEPTPYMQAKGIQPHAGALTDAEGQKTYIPATDAAGKQWTMQYIQEDGTKRFAKDSRKEGCFHAVGGIEAVAAAPALVIAEGYATAATLAEALQHGTVAAFDSGNLTAVAQALHEKFPDKPVVIAGDDDRHLEATQGINPGKVKAQEAAKAVGGKAIFPVFAPGEAVYPASLEPVTPQSYREHLRATKALEEQPNLSDEAKDELRRSQLSAEQLDALSAMKRHTDFNDLDTKSELGREGVERQARAAVGKAIEDQERKRERQQEQRQEQHQEQKQRRAARIG